MPLCPALLAVALLSVQATSPRDLYTRAVSLEAQGNHAAALALLWEAAGAAPRDADIQHRLGQALDRIGALDAAIDAYDRALVARPDYTEAANNLMIALGRAGRGKEAAERARTRATAAPGDVDRLFTLGLALSEQDVDEAMRTFRRVLTARPSDALAHYNLALLLKRMDRNREAIDELGRALDAQPRAEVHYTLGAIHLQQGDFDRAIAALKAAVAAEPRYVDAHLALGSAYKARGQLPHAVDALRRAIALNPEVWSAHAALATVLQLAGESDAARQEAAEAERRRLDGQREREAAVWTAVGIASLDKGDAAAAAEQFRRAVNADEDYAPAHYQLGRALRQLGQASEADAAFTRARQLNPSLVPPPR